MKLPIEAYNRRVPPEQRFAIEEELVEDVLDQVRTGRVSFESMGVGAARESADVEARVETPILQVVMTALWEKEAEQGSHTLRAQTLAELGGAEQLVRDRLDERMNRLDSGEQEIAAEVARFLVTPSGTKIAWTPADLTALAYPDTDLAEWAQPQVESVLAKLSEGDARILRPVAPPGGHGQTQYEIFHDILGPAILDWRARHIKDLELADAVRNVVGLVVLIGTTFWWLFVTLGVVVAGVEEDPNYFYVLIWTLSALVVFIGWWRVLRRRSGRRRTHLRFLLALVIAEIAAFTAPLSLVVIVPVALVRRRRAVPAASPGSS